MATVAISEKGKTRANPKANADNNFRVDAENAHLTQNGQDSATFTVTPGDNFVSMVCNGETITFTEPIPVINAGALRDAVSSHLLGTQVEGSTHVPNNTTAQENRVHVRATYDSGTDDFYFEHIGDFTIASLTTDNPATHNLTRSTTIAALCNLTNNLAGSIANLNDGTSTFVMPNTPYNYTGVPATDAATAAQLKTDVEAGLAALSISYTSVTVEASTALLAYVITINGVPNDKTIYAVTSKFTAAKCYQAFI